MNVTNSYRWTILGLMTFCLLSFAIVFQSIPPILGILVNTLGISHAQAGGLMSLFSLPAIFLALPGGVLVDRYKPRIVGGVSLLTMALGTAVVALGGSYWVMGLGRLMAGAGATFVQLIAPKVITSWFRDREIGLAMGVYNTAMPLGTVLSLSFMGGIASRFGWQASIWVSFAFPAVALCLFLILCRKRNDDWRVEAERPDLLSLVKKAGQNIWWVGLAWALFNASLISFLTHAPNYFVSQGESISKAGLMGSYPMWASILLAPLVGILIDRVGRRWLFVLVGCAGTAILMYLMSQSTSLSAILAISTGVFVAILTPGIFSLPAELLPESMTGFGFGTLTTAAGIGSSLGPYIVGSLRDATGNYQWGFVVMAILAALGIVPMLLLRRQIARTKPSSQR